MTHTLPPQLHDLLAHHGDFGMFMAMFLESSVIPIPSEIVIAAAGALGVSLTSIVLFGTLGSTLGGMVGYALGRFAGRPVIERVGKYIFITPQHIEKAEAFAKRHGAWSVLIGRVLPVIPFKVFSIAAGLTRLPFAPFVACTFIGVVPRLILLALFGRMLVQYTSYVILGCAVVVGLFFVYKIFRKPPLR
ncbi:MAG: DedA family protein [Candidatus Omnitrophica bacterium]|nr:DedA family protein [Candidatus Omnitrophota bacterium]